MYTYTDYEQLLHGLAHQLNVPVINGTIILPESVATGSFSSYKLPNGIQVNITDALLNQDWLIHRVKNREKQEVYTLRINELVIPGSLEVTIGDKQLSEAQTSRSVVYLTSSLFDWAYHGTKGTGFRGIDVMFSGDWIAKYMGIKEPNEVQVLYFSMQAERFNMEPLDNEYRRMMQEVFLVDKENPLWITIIQNRIMLMMERFFLHAFEKVNQNKKKPGLSTQDINRMMEVENKLTGNLFLPAPGIAELARMFAVSESKLKKDFKQVYGFPVHEYYRKSRMNAARDKLLTGNFSVKEVALDLGYSNLSNFTAAFKKEFGILPSQLI